LTQGPEEARTHQSGGHGSDEEVIADALQLLADFDKTPLAQMTPLFYQHAYEELRIIASGLLRILGHDPSAQQAR
jgi:hypothetical protein